MNRLPAVDALRGIAALWVVLLHCFHLFGGGFTPSSGPARVGATIAGLGYLGVPLFLVISGFCLTYPIARRLEPDDWRANWRSFFAARAWRILPPYYITLALCVVALHLFGPQSLYLNPPTGTWDKVSHALLLHNLAVGTDGSYNPVFWSLALEAQLYLLFPLVLWVVRRLGLRLMLLASFGLSLAWIGGAWLMIGSEWRGPSSHAVPARLFTFCLGVVATRAVAAPGPNTRRTAIAVSLLLLPAAVWSSWPAAGPIDWTTLYTPLQHWLWPVVFAGLLVWACLSRFPRWLTPLDFIGMRAYSLYLTHALVLVSLRPYLFGWSWVACAALAVPVTLAVAVGYFAAVEWPFVWLNDRIKRRHQVSAAVAFQAPL